MDNLKPDLVQTMQKYGVDTRDLEKRGTRRGKVLCPFHNDSNPSMVVYLDQNSWYCYVCAIGGDVYEFVGRLKFGFNWNPRDKSMFKEVLAELDAGNISKIVVKPAAPAPVIKRDRYILELATRAYHTAFLGKVGKEVREYLVDQRKLTLETLKRFRVGYAEPGLLLQVLRNNPTNVLKLALDAELIEEKTNGEYWEFFRKRITLPDIERGGGVRYMQSRDSRPKVPEGGIKYMGLRGSKTLFNGANVFITRPIFLVESPMDVYSIEQAGFQAEANLGTGMKQENVEVCKKQPILIAIPNIDPEKQGELAVASWKEDLPQLIEKMLPEGFKDVGVAQERLGTAGLRELLEAMLRESGVKLERRR
jgi:DNA primase